MNLYTHCENGRKCRQRGWEKGTANRMRHIYTNSNLYIYTAIGYSIQLRIFFCLLTVTQTMITQIHIDVHVHFICWLFIHVFFASALLSSFVHFLFAFLLFITVVFKCFKCVYTEHTAYYTVHIKIVAR